ncbi:uncharacterized protein NFIA_100030 [Aspergillus fischeri NRRL 181]|uniref:Uncharacterized protein n=1 Tax=Neosartorya fischeri (strain ATCC 1020 / DSM 3700 / CBS 544.65 / FGSC A1164 / JCM 1740 / NRRL 181 / WB 181) TaxID=331117 RepID=A1DBX6_NEOFI|nr:conserved hypothetical protein [Aspergillus fischeri NRRL 181]EAW20366.1 conserved hypothetical protein [Aspergillus fischeri NRRL 181]KAG2007894.1 hypothetical protein GB937_008085 [Aspergillus fischeri]
MSFLTDAAAMISSPPVRQDADRREAPSFSFNVLPLECRQQILCDLPDTESLKSAILSHSSLYSAFYNHKTPIILQIIQRHIPRDLLAYAVLCSHARNIEPWTRAKVLDILDLYFNRRLVESFKWTIRAALDLVKFHESVAFFADDYIDNALGLVAPLNFPIHAPSETEWCRVARVFYLQETIGHLFCFRNRGERWITGGINYARPSPSEFQHREKFDIFFGKHAPWEMEQIGAVNEYLYWRISPAFNNIAAHDVELGYYTVYFSDNETWEAFMGSQHKRGFLLKGLTALHRFVIRANHHSRIELISVRNSRCSNWLLVNELEFLQRFAVGPLGAMFYRDLTAEQIDEVVRKPFAYESDCGPQQAWQWAHNDARCYQIICDKEHRELRRFGYVMWDSQRLEKWRDLGGPFQVPQQDDDIRAGRRWMAMWPLIEKRRKMYEHGARGWWDGENGEEIRWIHGEKLPETQRRLLQ